MALVRPYVTDWGVCDIETRPEDCSYDAAKIRERDASTIQHLKVVVYPLYHDCIVHSSLAAQCWLPFCNILIAIVACELT